MSRLLAILATSAFLLAPGSGAVAGERAGPVQLAQNDPVIEKVFDALERRVRRAAAVRGNEGEHGEQQQESG